MLFVINTKFDKIGNIPFGIDLKKTFRIRNEDQAARTEKFLKWYFIVLNQT